MSAHVYLIDDDPAFRGSLAQILTSIGLICHQWGNPEDVMAGWSFERPGCLVLDYRLPGLSGLEVLKSVRRRTTIPAILISGYADVRLSVAAMRAGAMAVFEKPLDDNEFLAFIERVCFADRDFSAKRLACQGIHAILEQLSDAENDVLKLMLKGLPNKAIAQELDKGVKAVERNRQTLFVKLGVGSAQEAILRVSRCPVVEASPLSCHSANCRQRLMLPDD